MSWSTLRIPTRNLLWLQLFHQIWCSTSNLETKWWTNDHYETSESFISKRGCWAYSTLEHDQLDITKTLHHWISLPWIQITNMEPY
jgi:hypothetical protein